MMIPDDLYYATSSLFATSSLISLLVLAATVAASWMIYQKAGEEGWAAIVPVYNLYVLYKITWGNGWFFLLLLIPFANFVIAIITMVKLSKAFGKGGGWACGLIFLSPIFMMITGFSKDIQYVGVDGVSSGAGYQNQNYSYQNPYQQNTQQNTYQQQQSTNNPQYHYQTPTADANTNSTAKFCASCGTALDENTKFCPKCGQPR